MNYNFLLLLLGFILLPSTLLAQTPTWIPLVGIPGLDGSAPDFGTYINRLYALSISIAALLAVIKIIIAGVKYMLSDIVTQKGDAIAEIRGSIIGLVIVASAVLVLTVINPELTRTNVFSGITPINEVRTGSGGGSGVSPDIESLPGYRFRQNNNADPSFRTACGTDSGFYEVVRDPITNFMLEVCYTKLSIDDETRIRDLHRTKVSPEINEILTNYQKNIIPKEVRGNAGLEERMRNSLDLTSVPLILDVSAPDDWIDVRNQNQMNRICQDLRPAVHPEMVQILPFSDGGRTYIGCGYKVTTSTAG